MERKKERERERERERDKTVKQQNHEDTEAANVMLLYSVQYFC